MRKVRWHTLCIILVAFLVLSLVGAGLYAKYVRSAYLSGRVVFSTDLADSLSLVEHKAVRIADGSYALTEETAPVGNEYVLMPGVDVPKDPHFVIEGKSTVDAYLYVEVKSIDLPGTVTYSLTDNWKLLGIKGPNGGDLYAYSSDQIEPTVLNETFGVNGSGNIQILEDDTVYVSHTFGGSGNFSLEFYGYMAQQDGVSGAETSFKSLILNK